MSPAAQAHIRRTNDPHFGHQQRRRDRLRSLTYMPLRWQAPPLSEHGRICVTAFDSLQHATAVQRRSRTGTRCFATADRPWRCCISTRIPRSNRTTVLSAESSVDPSADPSTDPSAHSSIGGGCVRVRAQAAGSRSAAIARTRLPTNCPGAAGAADVQPECSKGAHSLAVHGARSIGAVWHLPVGAAISAIGPADAIALCPTLACSQSFAGYPPKSNMGIILIDLRVR
jgi:hypothetical protein